MVHHVTQRDSKHGNERTTSILMMIHMACSTRKLQLLLIQLSTLAIIAQASLDLPAGYEWPFVCDNVRNRHIYIEGGLDKLDEIMCGRIPCVGFWSHRDRQCKLIRTDNECEDIEDERSCKQRRKECTWFHNKCRTNHGRFEPASSAWFLDARRTCHQRSTHCHGVQDGMGLLTAKRWGTITPFDPNQCYTVLGTNGSVTDNTCIWDPWALLCLPNPILTVMNEGPNDADAENCHVKERPRGSTYDRDQVLTQYCNSRDAAVFERMRYIPSAPNSRFWNVLPPAFDTRWHSCSATHPSDCVPEMAYQKLPTFINNGAVWQPMCLTNCSFIMSELSCAEHPHCHWNGYRCRETIDTTVCKDRGSESKNILSVQLILVGTRSGTRREGLATLQIVEQWILFVENNGFYDCFGTNEKLKTLTGHSRASWQHQRLDNESTPVSILLTIERSIEPSPHGLPIVDLHFDYDDDIRDIVQGAVFLAADRIRLPFYIWPRMRLYNGTIDPALIASESGSAVEELQLRSPMVFQLALNETRSSEFVTTFLHRPNDIVLEAFARTGTRYIRFELSHLYEYLGRGKPMLVGEYVVPQARGGNSGREFDYSDLLSWKRTSAQDGLWAVLDLETVQCYQTKTCTSFWVGLRLTLRPNLDEQRSGWDAQQLLHAVCIASSWNSDASTEACAQPEWRDPRYLVPNHHLGWFNFWLKVHLDKPAARVTPLRWPWDKICDPETQVCKFSLSGGAASLFVVFFCVTFVLNILWTCWRASLPVVKFCCWLRRGNNTTNRVTTTVRETSNEFVPLRPTKKQD